MSLIKCDDCVKEISASAIACPYCGKLLIQNNKNLVQIDSAPKHRRKWRVRLLIFTPMFFFGIFFTLGSILSGDSGKIAFWGLIGFIGFVGMIASSIGNWLAKP